MARVSSQASCFHTTPVLGVAHAIEREPAEDREPEPGSANDHRGMHEDSPYDPLPTPLESKPRAQRRGLTPEPRCDARFGRAGAHGLPAAPGVPPPRERAGWERHCLPRSVLQTRSGSARTRLRVRVDCRLAKETQRMAGIVSGGLEGMAVLVTGGGTGIGRACAARARRRRRGRHHLRPHRDRSSPTRPSRSRQLAGHGGSVRDVAGDVTDEADVQRIDRQGRSSRPARSTACVANAGGGGGMGPYHLHRHRRVHSRAAPQRARHDAVREAHACRTWWRAGGGSFVGMSSIAGHVTHPYFGAYPVAKAGIEEMMRNAADEFGAARRALQRDPARASSPPRSWKASRATARSTTATSRTRRWRDVGEPEDVGAPGALPASAPSRAGSPARAINVDGGHAPAPRARLRTVPRAGARRRRDAGQAAEELSPR